MADLKALITDYLNEAKLMQLATSMNDQPWVCSVWFAADADFNIYWFSASSRRHSQELIKNNKVAGAMISPQTPQDKPRGLQFQGTAEVLNDPQEIDKAMAVYVDRIFPKSTIEKLMTDSEQPHKFYRIKPSQFVLFDGIHFGDNWRQEYNL